MNKRQEIMGNALGDGRRALSKEVPVGYKRTEVGVIPEEWSFQSLGTICDVRDGTHESPRFYSEGVPFVTSKNIVNGSLDLENTSYISEQDANEINKRSKVDPNDILMSMIGTIGSAVLIDFEPSFCIKNVALIKPQEVLPKFLIQLIVSPLFQNYLKDSLDGGIQKFVALGTLRHLNVPLPSSSEQRAIAEALSDVDELLGSLEKLIAKKRAIKQAAMQQLLTGKTRLPGFSGEWETKQLRGLIDLIPSGIYGSASQSGFLMAMPVATTAHIDINDTWNDKKMDIRYFTENQVAHFCPSEGDLVVVKSSGSAASIQSGKIGYVSRDRVGSFIFSNFLMLLRPTGCNARFLFFQLVSSRVKRMLPYLVEASTYPNIRINDYLDIQIPLPTEEEQYAIATVLSDMDAEIAALERRRDKTRAIKQGMMQQLLTGRVRLVKPE